MTSTEDRPTVVRRLGTPAALALGDLVSIFDELRTVLRCCERLVVELSRGSDDLVLEAVWTTATLSYARCFTTGPRGMGLTEKDVADTPLRGEVVEWHKVLRRLGEHYASTTDNPRERFEVAVVPGADGTATGIAITSTKQAPLDDVTVRQTGALAYELSQLVDKRITEHQEKLQKTAGALSDQDLTKLPEIELTEPIELAPPAPDTGTAEN